MRSGTIHRLHISEMGKIAARFPDKARGCWGSEPLHEDYSHGADGFRQFGQEADLGNVFPGGGRSAPARGYSTSGARRRPSGMGSSRQRFPVHLAQ